MECCLLAAGTAIQITVKEPGWTDEIAAREQRRLGYVPWIVTKSHTA
jgi:hypothetical protein